MKFLELGDNVIIKKFIVSKNEIKMSVLGDIVDFSISVIINDMFVFLEH